MSFKSFLSKHSHDLENIATALGGIVSLLPIGRQDKQHINSVIEQVNKASSNVAAAAAAMPDGADVGEVSTAAIEMAVNAALPDILKALEKKAAKALAPKAPKAPKAPATETKG